MRILLVEDNADHRELMSLALTGHDPTWQVEGVVSGEEALRRLGEEAYDLVFLDYSLPGRDGLEVLKEIRRGEAPPPVLMVTGRGDEQVAVEAMKGGAYDYVTKVEGYPQRLPVVAQRAVEAYRLATERKGAEEALRESEERYRLLFQRTPIGIVHYDTQLHVTDCNDRLLEILQTTRERAVGLDLKTLKDQSVLPALRQALEGREGFYEGSYRATTSSAEIWVSLHTAPLFDKHGRIIGSVEIIEDITERKRAEQALRESEEKFKNLVNSSNDIISTADESGNWTFLSPSVKRTLGYEPAEMIGRSAFDFMFPEDIASTREAHESVVREGRHFWEYENRWVSKDGRIVTLAWNVVAFLDEQGNIIGTQGVGRDITERKRAEEALRDREARLVKAQQVAHMGFLDWDLKT
ncbi:MAG: PAS domain S-box protein, partial [Anaerolineales bacterium]|nr:PAS domain S-box protein [Anaerolineales bacterium]